MDKIEQKLQYDNYWVSLLIQDCENSKPWLAEMQTCSLTLKDAMKVIRIGRENYRVLSAWIDCFDKKNEKTTIFHECYVNAIGNVERKG